MRRSLVVSAGLLAATALGLTVAALAPLAAATAPAKTTSPPGAPAAPQTTLWPSTTVAAPTTFAPVPTPASSAPPTTVPGTVTPPATAAPGAPFDAATFFRDFYTTIGIDPAAAIELLEASVRLGSAADAFLFHDWGVAIALFNNTTAPLPAYTVTPSGAALSVCRDTNPCETYTDFVVDDGLLSSFTVDGQPIEQFVSSFARATTVEALTVHAASALRRPQSTELSIALFMESTGGGTTFAWDQTEYRDATGRAYTLDLATSQVPARIEADGLNVAHLTFPGAPHGGQLVVTMTTDLTGVATTIRIPIVLNR